MLPEEIDPVQPSKADGELQATSTPHVDIRLNNIIQQIRTYIRDYPELNRLIAGVENSPRQICWAIFDTLDDFNSTPPFTQFHLHDFPSKSVFIRGVVCSLLESVGLLQTRNQISFTDGGIQVGISDKTPLIQSWLQLLRNAYEEKKMRIKVANNIETAWGGGVFSEFRFINNFYGEW